ncbi:Charged multivesicular body protein 7 [Frankliniella fusca]|uniref:Charged multivesicular body protein 7 n=1 Tax=Frankliniella fusca TaxID=407009 RepID=A0AAE1LE20_9NEOP|nr:Charged multivesicular body protein 7 [Frankliniella fusca]
MMARSCNIILFTKQLMQTSST